MKYQKPLMQDDEHEDIEINDSLSTYAYTPSIHSLYNSDDYYSYMHNEIELLHESIFCIQY